MRPPPWSVLLGIGSNEGDRGENIRRALESLRRWGAIEVVRVSALLETAPVGGPPQGRCLNAAAEVLTTLEPRPLLDALQSVEASLGRTRGVRFGPRPIDLDILLYDDRIVSEPGLEIPHPRMLERAFVLEPLAEIASARRHPVTGRTIGEHLAALPAAAAVPSPGGGAEPGGAGSSGGANAKVEVRT